MNVAAIFVRVVSDFTLAEINKRWFFRKQISP